MAKPRVPHAEDIGVRQPGQERERAYMGSQCSLPLPHLPNRYK